MFARRSAIALMGLLISLLAGVACAPAQGNPAGWATIHVTLGEHEYEVDDVEMMLELGEDGYYSIDGEWPETAGDCMEGLSGWMSLYGPLPASVRAVEDLAGRRLPVEFSGDGDDASFCAPGTYGLFAARDAWITIDAVDGDRVEFTIAGSFMFFNEDGERDPRQHEASGRGTAQLTDIYTSE